jgi:hypothetical protein
LAVALEDRKGWSFGARIYGYIVMEEETSSIGRPLLFFSPRFPSELAGGERSRAER